MTAHSDLLPPPAPAIPTRPGGMRWRAVVVLLATVVTVAVTSGMGLWQWGRAQEKRALEAALHTRAQQPPLDAIALQAQPGALPAPWQHRRVHLRGQWLHAHTFYLDNRQMQGRVGFFVVTPLRLDSGLVVAVQRGWVPRNFQQREQLPPVPQPSGPVEITGHLQPAVARLWEPQPAPDATGPIRQNVDLAQWRQASGLPLAGYVVRETTAQAADHPALLREWPAPASDVHKHYGYAAQWFAMAATALGLYLWFQVLRPRRRQASTDLPNKEPPHDL